MANVFCSFAMLERVDSHCFTPQLKESSGGDGAFLCIERNHHDEFDSRVTQPVAKTLGRIVPISASTEILLLEYRDQWRAEISNVGFSDNDFLFVSHCPGRSQGKPVT